MLLTIMCDLSFPVACIEVTNDLYNVAMTEVLLPTRSTPAINMERSTIQGDSRL